MTDIHMAMLNPVRMRIIQELALNERMTAAEINEKINDVSRTTLYRHINILLKNNILTIVSKKRVRGSLERTFALNIEEMNKHNQLENASQQALTFLMERYVRFHNYFNGEHPDPAKDRIFYNTTVLMMNDHEFDQFLAELRELIIKYDYGAASGRKIRDISVISSPAEME